METRFEIRRNLDDDVFYLFARPEFLFTNMFKAEVAVDEKKKKFIAKIPLKTFFLPFELVLEGHSYASARKIVHAFIIPDFAKHRDGIVRIEKLGNLLSFHIKIDLPLNFIHSLVLKKRIWNFRPNFDEIVRIERIKRKI